ncbi:LysR family transcriptional regulator [Microbulbifer flavimaris]|uniref:LysR family transcriptional regulator n=1 Tax=Microbulbifer flavimaris TaxID=1781068 RepID=A0ABX4I248_9GAMM|nr:MULTISPECIES: LysR family transcriptional regulator [Microbulbifer]KUJ84409.1 LysR family transcriptional regulator [Microbulbifer sp. ZGT114]PCO06494.1 LysR family transcriptional regulator [Microbulbifer flavimaris]
MSRLNYHHLYYFWQVARGGNLTQVANRLHISQSALSTQIKQLEESLGQPLFHRQGRKLLLTEAGQQVLTYANDIFRKGEELEAVVRQGISPVHQTLRIGMAATMSRNFIEVFIAPLLGDPGQRFSLQSLTMPALLDGLANHELDLVLTNTNVGDDPHRPWQVQRVASQPLSVIGPPDLKPTSAFPEGFSELHWLLPGRRSEMRQGFDAFCSLWQFDPQIQAEVDDMAMLRLLARDSGAVAVMPSVVVRDELASGKLAIYFTVPDVFEHFYAITVNRRLQPDALELLLSQQKRAFD